VKLRDGLPMTSANPRVLVVRLGAMGDVIHALPAVAMLRRLLPGARIGWVIEQRWQELLCAPGTDLAGPPTPGRPLVDEIHRVDTRAWRKRPFSSGVRQDFLSTIGHLRACHYATALDLQGAIKSALLARLSGAGLVVGFRQPRETLARCLYDKQVEARGAHVIDQNLELAQAWLEQAGLTCTPANGTTQPPAVDSKRAVAFFGYGPGDGLLPRHAASEARIDSILQSLGLGPVSRSGPIPASGPGTVKVPLAILNPGAGWAAKQWAPARYGELAVELARRGLRPVVNYGPGEETLAAEVAAASQGIAQPLYTSLSEFIGLARRALLFVGGDTGPMHLAALLGVKTVALFGPTDPARNGPYWTDTRTLRDPASIPSYSHSRTSDPGLAQLSVERVLAEIDALLQNQGKS
jgi:heptosyltransferase I